MTLTSTLLILLGAALPASALQWQVPAEEPTVQAALDQAQAGDTVLVAPGHYYETLRFRGEAVVLASHFVLDGDLEHLENTVLDGSQAADPDSQSTVSFLSGEDNGAELVGFTVTGGAGTRMTANCREGGGVYARAGEPTVRWNIFRDNVIQSDAWSTFCNGGGAMQFSDGAPLVEHNLVIGNRGHYGGGIVTNGCAGIFRHNIFVDNESDAYGGGGAMLLWGDGEESLIEHNLFIGNRSLGQGSTPSGSGAAVLAWNCRALLRHNIVWANTGRSPSLHALRAIGPGSGITGEYNLVEGGWSGPNTDAAPLFQDGGRLLSLPASPAVDLGADSACEDAEHPDLPGEPLPPALGSLACDAGVYGGPGAALLPAFALSGFSGLGEDLQLGTLAAGDSTQAAQPLSSLGSVTQSVDSVEVFYGSGEGLEVRAEFPFPVAPFERRELDLVWRPAEEGPLDAEVVLHTTPPGEGPLSFRVTGNALVSLSAAARPDGFRLEPVRPNPFNSSAGVHFSLARPGKVRLDLYDIRGRRVLRLFEGGLPAGGHRRQLEGLGLSSGIYYLELASGAQVARRKVLLLK